MSHWRIKGTAGPLANRSWPLRDRLGFIRGEGGSIAVSTDPHDAELAVLSLPGGTPPRLERLDDEVVLQVNGSDWRDGDLKIGDEIRIDTQRFLLQAPGLRPERVLAPERQAANGRKRGLWIVISCLLVAGAAVAWWLLR